MDNKALNEMVEKNIDEAEDVTGYEMSDADLQYAREMIAKLSGFYTRKDADKVAKRKIKAKRRAANRSARTSRRLNRKK